MIKFLKSLRKFPLFIPQFRVFSSKDDKFWEEYTKRKAQGGKYPAIESQEIIYNKAVHSWKYAGNHALSSNEVIDCLKDLKAGEESPYIIVDVREDIEFEIYKLPKKTKV